MAEFIDDALYIAGFTTTGKGRGGTPRCLCPEILNDEQRTKMSDMWAFACTAIQVSNFSPEIATVHRAFTFRLRL